MRKNESKQDAISRILNRPVIDKDMEVTPKQHGIIGLWAKRFNVKFDKDSYPTKLQASILIGKISEVASGEKPMQYLNNYIEYHT